MSNMLIHTDKIVNTNNDIARAAEAELDPNEPLPYDKTCFILRYKPFKESNVLDKKFVHRQGFQAAMIFSQQYCERMGYRWISMSAEYADLLFELNSQTDYRPDNSKRFVQNELARRLKGDMPSQRALISEGEE